MKKQEREEVWAEVDSKAQEVFQNGESLKSFLRISRHINRNLGQPEQEFMPDEFAVSEGMKGEAQPPEIPKAAEPEEKSQGQQQKGRKSKKQAER